jgi:hypothetical protein
LTFPPQTKKQRVPHPILQSTIGWEQRSPNQQPLPSNQLFAVNSH